MAFDYYDAIYNEMKEIIRDDVDFKNFDCIQDLTHFMEDQRSDITGAGQASKTCDSFEAKKNVFDNMGLLYDAFTDYQYDPDQIVDLIFNEIEMCDVIIREYLFDQVLSDVISDVEAGFDKAHEDNQPDMDEGMAAGDRISDKAELYTKDQQSFVGFLRSDTKSANEHNVIKHEQNAR